MKRQRPRKSVVHLSTRKGLTGLFFFASGIGAEYIYHDQNREPMIVHSPSNMTVQPCFTPTLKCQPLILREIQNARHSIHVMAYSFSAEPIARALAEAFKRGVEVNVIFDKSQLSNHSKSFILEEVGISIFIDNSVAIAHNKVMIFDKKRVITGSYNYSDVAEKRNAENLIIIDNLEVAQIYLENWNKRHEASTRKEMISYND